MHLPRFCNVQPLGMVNGPDGWNVWVDPSGDLSRIEGPVWVPAETPEDVAQDEADAIVCGRSHLDWDGYCDRDGCPNWGHTL